MKALSTFILSTISVFTFGQVGTLQGIVTDDMGDPLPYSGVQIETPGQGYGATTDLEGKYTISDLPVGKYDVLYTSMGSIDQWVYGVEIEENMITFVDVTMGESAMMLEEVTLESVELEKQMDYLSNERIVADEIYFSYDAAPSMSYSYDPAVEYDNTGMYADGYMDYYSASQNFGAGQLTATEINDFAKWELWNDIAANELSSHISTWKMEMTERYSVQAISETGMPILNAKVQLKKGKNVVWTAWTDNTGKAELWNGMYQKEDITNLGSLTKFSIDISYNGQKETLKNPKTAHQGPNIFEFNAECGDYSQNVDIAVVVDATGSMDDEIDYLKVELEDIIQKVQEQYTDANINTAAVFYKCTGNDYSYKYSQFTDILSNTVDYIRQQDADDGGDELVDSALWVTLNQLEWREDARTRLMFLVLDEPSAYDKLTRNNLVEQITLAASMGVKIIPVVASGEGYDKDKKLEYLVRCAALATNGSCAFITDDSGIGNSHTAPETDEITVETLNEMLLRIIDQNIYIPPCEQELFIVQHEFEDTTRIELPFEMAMGFENADADYVAALRADAADNPELLDAYTPDITFYPNPTQGRIVVEIDSWVRDLYISDMSGKLLEQIPTNGSIRMSIDLSQYPTGVYFLQCFDGDQPYSGKIVLTRY